MPRDLVLVSSCLAGFPCRYDGRARSDETIIQAVREGRAIPACAEQLGDLPTPRPAAEIIGGDGHDVLGGTAQVVTLGGEDVTAPFVAGARAVAAIAAEQGVTRAVLQDRSPSCGCGVIYDGSHTGELIAGDGVVAALLKEQGVSVTSLRGQHSEPTQ